MLIFLPEEDQDAPVVICSELPNNGGTSVTYAAEQLAAEVIRSHQLPTPLVWIEHWPIASCSDIGPLFVPSTGVSVSSVPKPPALS